METDESLENRIADLRARLRKLYSRDQYEIHERILDFHEGLKSKYPDYRECQLAHLISGSTIAPPYSRFDFPGEDSIASFIDREFGKAFGP